MEIFLYLTMENISNYQNAHKLRTQTVNEFILEKIEQYSNISDYYEFFNAIGFTLSKIPWAVFHLYPKNNAVNNTDNTKDDKDSIISLLHSKFDSWMQEPDTIEWNIYSQIQISNTPIISENGINIIMKWWYQVWFLEIPWYKILTERFKKNPWRQIKSIQYWVSTSIENALRLCELSFRFDDAQLDLLTGLFLRRYWVPKMTQRINLQIKEWKEIWGVIMIDLDHFKKINDTYGHDCWDMAIQYAANRIKSAISIDEDVAVRFWWEELTIYCPWKTIEEIFQIACALNLAIQDNWFDWNGKEIKITASIGVSDFSGIDTTLKTDRKMDIAIWRADKAMYAVKADGRNWVLKYYPWLDVPEAASVAQEDQKSPKEVLIKSLARNSSRTERIIIPI